MEGGLGLEGGLVGEWKGRRVEGKGKAAGREGRAVGREGVRWWEGVHRLLGGQCWGRDHHGGREVGGRSRKAREARSIGRALRREARLQKREQHESPEDICKAECMNEHHETSV